MRCVSFRVWNYEEPTLLNSFDNHEFPDKGISKLCLLNELDDSLLLVASGKAFISVLASLHHEIAHKLSK